MRMHYMYMNDIHMIHTTRLEELSSVFDADYWADISYLSRVFMGREDESMKSITTQQLRNLPYLQLQETAKHVGTITYTVPECGKPDDTTDTVYKNFLVVNEECPWLGDVVDIEKKNAERYKYEYRGVQPEPLVRLKPNQYLKNLRVNIPDADIYRVGLDIGGWQHENIYGKFFPVLRAMYGMSDSSAIPFDMTHRLILPYLSNHYTKIQLEYYSHIYNNPATPELILTMDVYETPTDNTNLQTETPMLQLVYSGLDKTDAEGRLRLCFVHPCYYIMVKPLSDKPVTHLRLVLGDDKHMHEIEYTAEQLQQLLVERFYIIPLTPSMKWTDMRMYGIDMSRVYYISIYMRDIINEEVEAFGLMTNIVRQVDGMTGIKYSK